MKVVVLGTRGFPGVQGGVEKHCEELYPRLAGLGCDVTVITRSPYIEKGERVSEWKGVRLLHLWSLRVKSLEAITHTFVGLIKAAGISPDILHIHSIGPALFTPLAAFAGFKTVMTHHGLDYKRQKWGPIARGVLRLGERAGLNCSHAVIAISRGIRSHIETGCGKKSFYIPNGADKTSPMPPGDGLSEYGLRRGGYVFTAARFVPEKGLLDLIEAYRMIENPPFKLVIAGDADHETGYSQKIKRLASKSAGVVLTGFLSGSTIVELFSNASLFVLPSHYEGLPITLLEALSFGLPLLVSDIPQHKEVPLRKYCYFEKGNIRALSEAMAKGFSRGITDYEKAEYASLLEKEYNWDRIALSTLEVYKEVLRS
jgi:glycosyltransferase involved in cell wall biosynthesis